ncbi:sulfate respiration complex iron-sulfur protein HmcB [Desulfocicer niacini]
MSITRRKFIEWMGLAGAGTALGPLQAQAASNAAFKGYPDSFGVLHDITACVGCRSCEEACNRINVLPDPDHPFNDAGVFGEKRRPTTKAYTVVNRYDSPEKDVSGGGDHPGSPLFRKTQCNHCLEPACASVCFVKAFEKTAKGPVVYDPTVCVGCRYCMVACPFEIPSYEYEEAYTPSVVKCTMCSHRVEKGELPGCVEACPTEALIFGKRKNLLKIAREKIRKHPHRYLNHIYGEKEMGGTSWMYLSGVPFSEVGLREDLGETPAPAMTSGALGVIPMVVGLWPVFLAGMYGMNRRREKIAQEEKSRAVAHALDRAQTQENPSTAKGTHSRNIGGEK